MHRKLLNLLRANARKGEFKAEGNTIFVYDAIVPTDDDAEFFGGISAEGFVKTLRGLSGDVDVRVNSPGGEVFGAKAMAQAIREYPGSVTVHVDGVAASAATFLTSAGDKTVVAPGSMLMIHKGWTLAIGNADDFRARASLLDKFDLTVAADYAAAATRRGVEAGDFLALMAAETWFSAAEAIAVGLADEIGEAGPKAKVKWDLSAYEHPPSAGPDEEEEVPEDPDAIDPPLAAETVNDEIEEPARPNVAADLLLRPAA